MNLLTYAAFYLFVFKFIHVRTPSRLCLAAITLKYNVKIFYATQHVQTVWLKFFCSIWYGISLTFVVKCHDLLPMKCHENFPILWNVIGIFYKISYEYLLNCISVGAGDMGKLDYHHFIYTLQWRHNGYNGVSNYQHHDCLLNRLSRRRSKKKHQSFASLTFVRGIHRWPVPSWFK